jgi:Zn-dependent alcohol dehydrogenase
MKRDKVIESIKELPQEFELETLIERLIFIEKVEQGLKQIDEGKTISHEHVVEIAKKW